MAGDRGSEPSAEAPGCPDNADRRGALKIFASVEVPFARDAP
jgi:hypothetical protein